MDIALWHLALEWVSWLFLGFGSFFVLTGVIGILRLPDIWTRLHAVSLTDTLGLELILIGLMIQCGWTLATLKLLFIGLFILFTGPTATHALANAAYISHIAPDPQDDESSHA